MEDLNAYLQKYWNESLGKRIRPNGFECNKEKWRIVAKILKKHPIEGLTKLELGCGTGHYAKNYGWDKYTGIDISDVGIKYAKRINSGRTFIQTPCEDFKPKEKYDVIIAMDSLEHIPFTRKFIQMIRSASHDKTFFIGNVPMAMFSQHCPNTEHKMDFNILNNFLVQCYFPHVFMETYYLTGVYKSERIFLPMMFFKAVKEMW